MTATATPFGLRPVYHMGGGIIRPVQQTIPNGYANNIYQFSPVGMTAAGVVALAAAGGSGATGACGVFMGCEFTDISGRRQYRNLWPASTVATDAIAYITMDPQIAYEVQADGVATIPALTELSAGYNWTANGSANGNTTTGISSVALSGATISTAAAKDMQVVDIARYVDNAFGDTFPILIVRLGNHQFLTSPVAF
jgi:hypothetical protein